MAVVGRVLAFIIGAGLGVAGFFLWMLSNDEFLADERTMKMWGGAGMIVGLGLCVVALFWKGSGARRK